MCGIAGLIPSPTSRFSREELSSHITRMTDSIRHRGPDGSGTWIDQDRRACLGHRRLSIIDVTSAGSQPFFSKDGRYVLTFNGEIYNFLEIRAELETLGVCFTSRSDTEVLMESIIHWGPEAIPRFDGMFAFALFDTVSGDLIFARDPFGEKPFYYTILSDGTFAFASELCALELLPGFDNTISADAIAEYFAFQYIGGERSIYRSVFKLKPGHYGVLKHDSPVSIERYFAFNPRHVEPTGRKTSDLADELEDILTRSLKRRLIADVPLGAFLSGGVDSSVVCALATKRLGVDLNTYSMGFKDSAASEHEVAQAFASHLGTLHHEQIIVPDMADFLMSAGQTMDEPNGDTSCMPTYLLSQFTRRDVTVAVSGDGGDELFGGYGRYIATMAEHEFGHKGELISWKPGETYYGPRILAMPLDRVSDLFGHVPDNLKLHIDALRQELNQSGAGLLAAMRRSDVDNYLPGAVIPKVDRMSMQHALEVRTPFLNVELARFSEGLADKEMISLGKGKRILREVAYRYLPRHLIDMPKRGFGLPMGLWGQENLVALMKAKLGGDSMLRAFLGDGPIDILLARQENTQTFNLYELWPILILEQWLRARSVKLESYAQPAKAMSSPPRLYGFAIAERTYVLSRGSDLETLGDNGAASWPLSLAPVCERLYDKDFVARNRGPQLVLPLWGQASDTTAKGTDLLPGATLIFTDAETPYHLDTSELERLAGLGVRRLVCVHRSLPGKYEDIELRPRSLALTLKQKYILRRKRIVKFSANPRKIRKGSAPMARVGGQLFHSGPHSKIAHSPGIEVTSRYAIFENGRQLSPIQMGQDEIREMGDGRNCVIDQIVCLSPTDARPHGDAVYWMVPVNSETRPLLSYAQTDLKEGGAVAEENRLEPEPLTGDEKFEVSATEAFYRQLFKDLPPAPVSKPLARGAKIALVTHAFPSGGAERQWVYLAQTLKKEGYDVSLITYCPLDDGNDHYLSLLGDAGIEVIDTERMHVMPELSSLMRRYGNDFPAMTGVARVSAALRDLKPDAVIAQLDEPNIVAATAALMHGVPHISISFRNYNPSNFKYIYQPWLWYAYKALVGTGRIKLTGNFSGANEDYAKWLNVDPARIHAVINAIDDDMFDVATSAEVQKIREELNVHEDSKIVLGVFRLSEEKKPEDFIDVCAAIAGDVPDAVFVLAGRGPMCQALQERIDAHGLSDRFRLLGARRDVNALMRSARLLLHTAGMEGTPNVILEAGLSGIPVVATHAGAVSEIVIDGETGFVLPVGDVAGLARASVELLTEKGLGETMGQAAKTRISEKFSRKRSMDSVLEALNS